MTFLGFFDLVEPNFLETKVKSDSHFNNDLSGISKKHIKELLALTVGDPGGFLALQRNAKQCC